MKRQGVTDLRGAALAARLGVPEVDALAALAEVDDLPDDPWVAQADSPIERMFLAAMVKSPEYNELDCTSPYTDSVFRYLGSWAIKLQQPVGGYTVDILLEHISALEVAIELDGHDYHERTKEQAARDRRKDRELLRLGTPVIRFTGSEVYRDPEGCVAELVECLLAIATQNEETKQSATEYHAQELHDARFAQCAYDVSRSAVTLRSIGHFDRANLHEEHSRELWKHVCFKSMFQEIAIVECAYP